MKWISVYHIIYINILLRKCGNSNQNNNSNMSIKIEKIIFDELLVVFLLTLLGGC